MAAISGPNIPLDGLVFNMDPASALSYPARNDPFRDQVSLLLDGTSFTDKSRNNFTVTAYGNAQIISDNTFGSVMSFDGNGDSVTVPSNAAFAFGTGDFTIEGWLYSVDTGSSVRGIFDTRASVYSAGIMLRENSGGFLVYMSGSIILSTTSGRVANQYQHISLVRRSGVLSLYIDGVLSSSVSNSTNLTDTQSRVSGFVDTQNNPYGYNGRIAFLRIVKGIALYTANFTPPSTPLSLPSRIKDIKNDIIGTLTNGPVYSNVQKGAISFDGSDDYIIFSRPSQLVTGGQISISMWARWVSVGTSIGTIQMLLDNNHTGSQGFLIQDRPDLGKVLTFNSVATTNIIGDGLWHHIVGTNDGITSRIYIDGILNNSSAEANGLKTVQPSISLGKWQGGTRYLNGSLGKILIYNRALSASEIKDIYTSEREKYVEIPKTISGLQLWLDGADLSTLRQNSNGTTAVVLNSDPIGYWGDKSGNGRHATQATAGSRPYFLVGNKNGLSAISCNSAQFLTQNTGTIGISGSNGRTVFTVQKEYNPSTTYPSIIYWGIASSGKYYAHVVTNGIIQVDIYASSATINIVNGQYSITTSTLNSSNQSMIRRNKSNWSINTTSVNTTDTAYVIGKSITNHYFTNPICEVLVYNRNLSNDEIAAIENYLNKKWGVF